MLFLSVALNGLLTLPITIFFLFLFLSCIGFTYPNAAALSLAPFTKNAGSASAMMGAIQMGMGTLISVVISLFEVPSAVPMIAAMAGSATLAFSVLLIGRRTITKQVDVQESAGVMH